MLIQVLSLFSCLEIHLAGHATQYIVRATRSAPNPFEASQCIALKTFSSRSCSSPCGTQITGITAQSRSQLLGYRCSLYRLPWKITYDLQHSLDGHPHAPEARFLASWWRCYQAIPDSLQKMKHDPKSYEVKKSHEVFCRIPRFIASRSCCGISRAYTLRRHSGLGSLERMKKRRCLE